jgi:hypothetical protein
MITKEFLETELQELESEVKKAEVFLIRAQAVSGAYKMLLAKFEDSSVVEENADGDAN